jgi:hypothetical protein
MMGKRTRNSEAVRSGFGIVSRYDGDPERGELTVARNPHLKNSFQTSFAPRLLI